MYIELVISKMRPAGTRAASVIKSKIANSNTKGRLHLRNTKNCNLLNVNIEKNDTENIFTQKVRKCVIFNLLSKTK